MKLISILSFLVFICFLVLGYSYSTRFYQPGEPLLSTTVKIAAAEGTQPISSLQNGQRNILVIGADRLQAHRAQLENLWLVTYLPGGNSIQLFPIFPSGNVSTSGKDVQLRMAFALVQNGTRLELDQRFSQLLEEQNYWWSGYVILDKFSSEKLAGMPVAEVVGIPINDEEGGLHADQPGEGDPTRVYSSQLAIVQSLCHKLTGDNPGESMAQFAGFIPDHIQTDLDIQQLQRELSSLASVGHAPACRFPTLEMIRLGP